jgi:hypothetical protein
MKYAAIGLFVLLALPFVPMATTDGSVTSTPTTLFLPSSAGQLSGVPYEWQEINGFCAWAASAMALQYIGVNVNMHDVFAASSIGFSFAYIHYNDTILVYPGVIYTQAEPINFLADLYGVNYTIYLSEELSGASDYEQIWESEGINVGLLSGQTAAFNLMRSSINAGYPLLISVDPMWLPEADYDYLRTEGVSGGAHAVLIVGYNDTQGVATIMDPGVGSFGSLFGYPTDGRGINVSITYTALNNAWSSRYYISNLFKPLGQPAPDFEDRLGQMIRDKLLGVGDIYAPGSTSAYLWSFGENGFRKMAQDFTVDGLSQYMSIFDGIENERMFKSSILLFIGLGIETAVTLQYLSYRTALESLPSLMPDTDLTAFVNDASKALPDMAALSSNSTLIYPGDLSHIEGLVSKTFYNMSQQYNSTGDLGATLSQYSSELNEISSHLLGIADSWQAAGNALADIWPNNPFIVYEPFILLGVIGAGAVVLFVIVHIRTRPSQ